MYRKLKKGRLMGIYKMISGNNLKQFLIFFQIEISKTDYRKRHELEATRRMMNRTKVLGARPFFLGQLRQPLMKIQMIVTDTKRISQSIKISR